MFLQQVPSTRELWTLYGMATLCTMSLLVLAHLLYQLQEKSALCLQMT